jgi:hypothetical protein
MDNVHEYCRNNPICACWLCFGPVGILLILLFS